MISVFFPHSGFDLFLITGRLSVRVLRLPVGLLVRLSDRLLGRRLRRLPELRRIRRRQILARQIRKDLLPGLQIRLPRSRLPLLI